MLIVSELAATDVDVVVVAESDDPAADAVSKGSIGAGLLQPAAGVSRVVGANLGRTRMPAESYRIVDVVPPLYAGGGLAPRSRGSGFPTRCPGCGCSRFIDVLEVL